MARINNHLVIMAGGVGSRFWPMSTAEKPKQFIDVLGIGKSLLQLTVERFAGIVDAENLWVVTNKSYAATVAEQLPDMPKDHILCEPCRRNTAPCIAYVSWRIKSRDPKANIVVSPSDHVVMNVEEFRRVITDCMKFTSDSDAIVTLGMKPTRPAQQGYLPRRFIPREARSGNGIALYPEEQLLLECRHLHLECEHYRQRLPHLSACYVEDFRRHAAHLRYRKRAGED